MSFTYFHSLLDICFLSTFICWGPKPQVPQNVIAFEYRVFKKVIKLKMMSLELALIQYDWYPYKKTELGHECTQKKDKVKTRGEGGHL